MDFYGKLSALSSRAKEMLRKSSIKKEGPFGKNEAFRDSLVLLPSYIKVSKNMSNDEKEQRPERP